MQSPVNLEWPLRTQRRERNRAALLTAAEQALVDVGYRAMTLVGVARAADLTTGAIYSIFQGKRNLLLAVLEELGTQDDGMRLEELVQQDLELTDAVKQLAERYVEFAARPESRKVLSLEVEIMAVAVADPIVAAAVIRRDSVEQARFNHVLVGRPHRRGITTEPQAARLGRALKALLVAYGQGAVLEPDESQDALVVDACLALVALVDSS